jgi:hypothetical protein
MELTIDGVRFRIVTHAAQRVSPRERPLWCTADWECLQCGRGGYIGTHAKQDSETGALAAAQGDAERHAKEAHGAKTPPEKQGDE